MKNLTKELVISNHFVLVKHYQQIFSVSIIRASPKTLKFKYMQSFN